MGDAGRHRAVYTANGIIIDLSAMKALQAAGTDVVTAEGKRWSFVGLGSSYPVLQYAVRVCPNPTACHQSRL